MISEVRQSTPATPWRVFFLLMGGPVFGGAPVSPPSELSQLGKPDAVEAARFLEESRRSGMPGEYYLEFELRDLPRQGEVTVFRGRLWVGSTPEGAMSRIEVTDGGGRRHALLVRNGERPAIWRLVDGEPRQLGPDTLFIPLIPGVEVTAFDLLRSYLHWADATLQSINRVLGRPAYAYLFRAPPGLATGEPRVAMARAYFDTQFKQPLQSELLDEQGRVLKTFSVVSLKTVDGGGANPGEKLTLPKEVDFRNEGTRDKTRLQITAVAVKVRVPPGVFEPAELAGELPAPPVAHLIQVP